MDNALVSDISYPKRLATTTYLPSENGRHNILVDIPVKTDITSKFGSIFSLKRKRCLCITFPYYYAV